MERKVVIYAVVSRVLVAVVMLLTFYSYWPGEPPAPLGYEQSQGPLNWSPLNPFLLYDGGQYVKIAEHGYSLETTVWFPLYPMIIRYLGVLLGNFSLAAVLISHAAFLGAVIIIYRLARLDLPPREAILSAIALSFFPAGVFFSCGYSESLFLLLVLLSFYSARKGNWVAAGFAGGLAAMTRNLGILLFPALIIEYWQQSRGVIWGRKNNKELAGVLLIPAGLGIYLLYLWQKFNQPLAFIQGQSSHFRSMKIPGWGLMADLVHMAGNITDPLNLVILLNLVSFVLILVSIFYSSRWSYQVYSLLYLLVITSMPLAGGSMPHSTGLFRFALGVFPIYLAIGSVLQNKISNRYFALVALGLLSILANLLARKLYLA